MFTSRSGLPRFPASRETRLTALPALASVVLIAIVAAVAPSGPGGVPEAASAGGRRALLIAQDQLVAGRDTRDALLEAGARPLHLFPPDAAVAWLPDGAEAALAARWPGLAVYGEGDAPAIDGESGPPAAAAAVAYWRARADRGKSGAESSTPPHPDLSEGDLLVRPPSAGKDAGTLAAAGGPSGAGFWDLTEYMLGDVAVSVVFVESDGSIDANSENWTPALQANVQSEVPIALDWWIGLSGSYPLTFTYTFATATTGYEPITRPQSDESLWVAAAMANLGYGIGDYFTRSAKYDNDLRDDNETHWAFTVFVVNSLNDPDGRFSNNYFAYAYLGGPFMVTTYDNNGWGIANYDAVLAHEMGHIFYALDEYASAAIPCTRESGYLEAENGNSAIGGCPSSEATCIMRSVVLSTATLESFSRGQIGWTDGDVDGIADPMDTQPGAAFDPYVEGADPYEPALSGLAQDLPLDNKNPYGYASDLTLNTVAGVEWRVDGGAWAAATPSDGAWDATDEAFTLQSAELAPGTHVFEVRVTNSVGNVTEPAAAETILVSAVTAVGDGLNGDGAGGNAAGGALATRLGAAVPNPARPETQIFWSLAAPAEIDLSVFDVSGRRVRSVARGSFAAGAHDAPWDGRDDDGRPAASGVYLYSLEAPGYRETKRLTLVR